MNTVITLRSSDVSSLGAECRMPTCSVRKINALSPWPEIASDGLKGRVFEVSLADLQNDEVAFRKFKLITEDVQGKNCLTNFHGMDLTRDKMCSMVKKWQVGPHFPTMLGPFSDFFAVCSCVRANFLRI